MIAKLKHWIQSTIGLNSTEATALMVLLPLLFLAVFSEPLYRWFSKDKPPLTFQETVFRDSLVALIEKQKPETIKDSLFLISFDPNRSTLDELNSLGIPEKISRRIVQYRTKGGIFRIRKDVAKMYGMDSSLYKKLFPFIALPEKIENAEFVKFVIQDKPETVIQFDINLADTTSFKSVKGIGSVLAKRIVKYREGLGGFVSLNQLSEIYGLDSLAIRQLYKFYVSDGFIPRKIEINRASEKELDIHPYLSLREAHSIFTFRAQHGNYNTPAELLKIKTLNENLVNKLSPYLSFE